MKSSLVILYHREPYDEIVKDWGIPKRTIQSCYDRETKRVKPYLKKILQY